MCDEEVEFEVRLSCVVGFCSGKGGASGSAALPCGSGEMFGCIKGSGVVGKLSLPRSGGQVLSEADGTGGGFSLSAEIASPEFDKRTDVSLRGGINAAAAMTALSPYKADFGTTMGLGDSAGREGAEEEEGGATD